MDNEKLFPVAEDTNEFKHVAAVFFGVGPDPFHNRKAFKNWSPNGITLYTIPRLDLTMLVQGARWNAMG